MPTPEDPHAPGNDDSRREALVLIALGEPVEDSFRHHLSTCLECSQDLAAYQHSVALARAGGDDRSAAEDVPPPSVWAGISRTLGLDADAAERPTPTANPTGNPTANTAANPIANLIAGPDAPAHGTPPTSAIRPGSGRTARADGGRDADSRVARDEYAELPRTDIDELRRARRRHRRTALIAAAAAVLVGICVGAGVLIGRGERSSTAGKVLYQGQLSQQGGGPANVSGVATVHTKGGSLAVSVDAAGLPLRPGYYQVWLYDPTHKHMLPIGVLGRDGTGTFPLAADVDLRLYDIVNISAQDYDGVYTHKTTVLQGPLRQ